jgi:hypothetical protein
MWSEGEGREGERETDLFSIHNCSRVQIDVDSIPVLANFKTIHLYIQVSIIIIGQFDGRRGYGRGDCNHNNIIIKSVLRA